jgi:hypothetical protein
MENDIMKFADSGTREEFLLKEFLRLAAHAKNKQELRELEMALLKPTPIPSFKKQITTGMSDFQLRTVTMTFPNKRYVESLSKYMRINSYKGNNSHDMDILVEFINLLESGRLRFDTEEKKLKLVTKKRKVLTL